MKSVASEMLAEKFKEKLLVADEVKTIVLEKIDIIKEYIFQIKDEISANIITDDQDGCLEGQINDFIKEEDFDALFDTLISQFDKNDESLQEKINGTDKAYETQLIEQCDKIHTRL